MEKKNKNISEGQGSLHMEKNWGQSFPQSWVWGQGHELEEDSIVMIAGGPLPGPLPIESHLIGFKNPKKSIFNYIRYFLWFWTLKL